MSRRSDAQDLVRWVVAESGRQTESMETRPFNAQDVSMVAFDTWSALAALAKAVETLLDECTCVCPDHPRHGGTILQLSAAERRAIREAEAILRTEGRHTPW